MGSVSISSLYKSGETFFRESVISSIADIDKRIVAVALIAICCVVAAILGLVYLLKKDAKESKELKELSDKTGTAIAETSDKITAVAEKVGETPVSKTPEPVTTGAKAPEPVATGAKPGGLANDLKLNKVMSIIYQGFDPEKKMKFAQLDDLAAIYDEYSKDLENQEKKFGNKDKECIYIDYSGFGKANGLDEISGNLEAFLRFLVLDGRAYAYRKSRIGYCLYLTENAYKNNTSEFHALTRAQLIDLDSVLSSLKFPLDVFVDEEKEIAAKCVAEIKKSLYWRAIANIKDGKSKDELLMPNDSWPSVITFSDLFYHQPTHVKVMDKMVGAHGFMESWNFLTSSGAIVGKCYKFDPVPSTMVFGRTEWRGLEIIQQEEKFQKEHQIEVKSAVAVAAGLTPSEQVTLGKLVNKLNQRVKAGSIKMEVTDGMKILQFLKGQKAIHDFKKQGWNNDYVIYVSPEDKVEA